MTYVAIVALTTAGLVTILSLSLVRVFRAMFHEQQRVNKELVNQLMHLSGRTWAPPPAEEQTAEPEAELAYMFVPEQEPDEAS